jgi:membrane protease YdiL (CAAX protease family)
MEEIVASSTGLGFVAVLLCAGLFAGVGEELFFRGFLQTRLRQRWGVWPAICVTALAFGILHYDPVHSVMAFGMGVFLGWLVERTGSIRPAIAAHVLNNTAWILAAGSYGEPTAFGMELAILAGSLVVLAIATVSFAALTRPAR